MKENGIESVFIIKNAEYMIMACIAGMKYLIGPDKMQRSLNDEILLETLQDMANKEMILLRGDEFTLCEPYRSIFADMAETEHILTVRRDDGYYPVKYCYMGRRIWCVSTFRQHREKLRCVQIEEDGLAAYLLKEEYLPVQLERGGGIEGKTGRGRVVGKDFAVDRSLAVMESRSRSNEILRTVQIGWYDGELILVDEKENERTVSEYHLEKVRQLLQEIREV